MTKKDTYVVRSGSTGTAVKLPGGRRVHSLDRAVFESAIRAANSYISERKSANQDVPLRSVRPQTSGVLCRPMWQAS